MSIHQKKRGWFCPKGFLTAQSPILNQITLLEMSFLLWIRQALKTTERG